MSTAYFKFFQKIFNIFSSERRRRDLNPRAAINDLHPFQGCPFGQLGYFSKLLESTSPVLIELFYLFLFLGKRKRRGWDSNPRALADKRFSRPPRYDHFDTSPYVALSTSAEPILPPLFFNVNRILQLFYYFFKNTSATLISSGVVIFILV